LHFHDTKQLLAVLRRLRDHNNTIIVIEHNLDVIKTADWIIDLRPEGGDGGGISSPSAHLKRLRTIQSLIPGGTLNRCPEKPET